MVTVGLDKWNIGHAGFVKLGAQPTDWLEPSYDTPPNEYMDMHSTGPSADSILDLLPLSATQTTSMWTHPAEGNKPTAQSSLTYGHDTGASTPSATCKPLRRGSLGARKWSQRRQSKQATAEKRYRASMDIKMTELCKSVPHLRAVREMHRGANSPKELIMTTGLNPVHRLNKGTVGVGYICDAGCNGQC